MEQSNKDRRRTGWISPRRLASALFAFTLLVLVGPANGPYQRAAAQQPVPDLSAPEAEARMQEDGLLLIDVRSKLEWAETGIPKGAEAITIHEPRGVGYFVMKVSEAAGGERDRPIAFICATGVRSAYAYSLLKEAGFSELYNITEGMLGNPRHGPGWLKRGLPTEPCPDC
ncbi:MAG: rhodanese-like domain-containing protein [Limibacillus sp.]|jgi:rhodanese-related sulfurtransferase